MNFSRHLPAFFAALLFLLTPFSASAQKLIEYQSGIGSRDPEDPDVWILYRHVRATHEGMVLYADSAVLNTQHNDFTAFDHVKIELSDTTFIYGDNLFYDGNTRIVDIYADTVVFIDGATILKTAHLSFDRNSNEAHYFTWGHTTSDGRILESRMGSYNASDKIFNIFRQVSLRDSTSLLTTDTLLYDTKTDVAFFVSPTNIVSDSTTIYSEFGSYNTNTRYAVSTKASQVRAGVKKLTCDTLYYDDKRQVGTAFGNVRILDTLNDVSCFGNYGITNQREFFSFVTDSALVIFVDKGDSVFLHADTVFVFNDSLRHFHSVTAAHHVKVFRNDAQCMCDSAIYSAADSLGKLFYDPVVWYGNYQCSADTILVYHDTAGFRLVLLRGNLLVEELVDSLKFNQVRGRNGDVHFSDGEPAFGNVLGNAEMVFYITEEDDSARLSLIGVNAGIGSDMRVYFLHRQMYRLVTYGNPDMHTYPLDKLPTEFFRLKGFRWLDNRRPKSPSDVYWW